MKVKGTTNSSDSCYTPVVINGVPDFGPEVEIDRGPYCEDYD